MEWSNVNPDSQWRSRVSNYDAKVGIARAMATRLRDGDVVGVGSGSTSLITLHTLAEVAKENGWRFSAITTSLEMEMACATLGVTTLSLLEARPAWSFDGADEVDDKKNMIKGRGGAMVREKLVMSASLERYVVVDSSKLVKQLGEVAPIPIEIVPESLQVVQTALRDSFSTLTSDLRMAVAKDGPVITEYGNLILDVRFEEVTPDLDAALNSVVGVVGTGLFVGFNPTIVGV